MYAKWPLVLSSLSKAKLSNIAQKKTTRSDNDKQNYVGVEIQFEISNDVYFHVYNGHLKHGSNHTYKCVTIHVFRLYRTTT